MSGNVNNVNNTGMFGVLRVQMSLKAPTLQNWHYYGWQIQQEPSQ